ncbi:hypothetical protein GKQ77_00705 [Streptomyces sp. BG9H]|uniref:Uncharacterized protein n=1 Tax=Streptomyces anatolicus TaxID=2675858 RepID=A0ABS6YHN6_9ACTN|nr:hypothetical protein [Streptomyces anatolicus]
MAGRPATEWTRWRARWGQSYADIVHDRVTAGPRDGVLLVVGDFDCSGEDIERDWITRTGYWAGPNVSC